MVKLITEKKQNIVNLKDLQVGVLAQIINWGATTNIYRNKIVQRTPNDFLIVIGENGYWTNLKTIYKENPDEFLLRVLDNGETLVVDQ